MLFSPSSHLGESIFTSTRAKNSKIFYGQAHLERLIEGIEDYYLGKKLSAQEVSRLEEIIADELSNLEAKECRLRITVQAKEREVVTKKSFAFEDLHMSVQAGELKEPTDEVICKSFPSPFSPSYPKIKMGSYMPLLRLRMMAQREGLSEAAVLDNEGNLMELATSNLFFYKGKRIFTPRKTLLDGVIKKAICDIYPVEELDITPGSSGEFDGCFCTNSVWVARPVQSIDQTKYKNSDQLFVQDMVKQIIERGYE